MMKSYPNEQNGGTVMKLFRPIGEKERLLIIESGYTAFPPRLPEQPIFYPVLNERYATEIAGRWNLKDKASGFKGFVTQFEIEDSFISNYDIQTVGASYHQEYWIPADDLDNFNHHIIGQIEVIREICVEMGKD